MVCSKLKDSRIYIDKNAQNSRSMLLPTELLQFYLVNRIGIWPISSTATTVPRSLHLEIGLTW